MIADHLTSEVPVRVTARNRTIDEWQLLPGRDNHWLDAECYAYAAACLWGLHTKPSTCSTRSPLSAAADAIKKIMAPPVDADEDEIIVPSAPVAKKMTARERFEAFARRINK
jgi:phage terminase large subunit GpA-like protein